jgi:hypothetical protein
MIGVRSKAHPVILFENIDFLPLMGGVKVQNDIRITLQPEIHRHQVRHIVICHR